MTDTTRNRVGLFLLNLEAPATGAGAPTLYLSLTVDTVRSHLAGCAEVTQALKDPVVATSHVTGTYEEEVFGAEVTIDAELTGYPEIYWPPNAGIGPVIPANFRAKLQMTNGWESGKVVYQYVGPNGQWVKVGPVPIEEVQSVSEGAKVAAE